MVRWLLFAYVIWNSFFAWMPYAVYKHDAAFKAHAVPSNAQLIKHFYVARSISGVVRYRVGDYVYTETVGLSRTDSPSDANFAAAISSATIPILYDPQKPSHVVANNNNRFTSKTYLNGYFFITAISFVISSIFFLPVILAVRRSERAA